MILVVLFLVLLGLAFLLTLAYMLWLLARSKRSVDEPMESEPGEGEAALVRFSWRHIALPAALFLLTMALVASFYPGLPPEIATPFNLKGSANGWMSKATTAAIVLGLQAFLLALAFLAVYAMAKVSRLLHISQGDGLASPGRLMSFAGNMVALPQAVIGLVTLDTLWYNLYQQHVLPIWILLLVIGFVAAAGSLFLFVSLARGRQERLR